MSVLDGTQHIITFVISTTASLCLELHKGDMMPTDAEFTTLELFVKVTKPLVDITEAIGAERWVTFSVVHPLLHICISF